MTTDQSLSKCGVESQEKAYEVDRSYCSGTLCRSVAIVSVLVLVLVLVLVFCITFTITTVTIILLL